MDWEPSESDKAWTAQLAAQLKNGGTWGVPANGSFWRIYHDDRRVEIINRGTEPELTERIIKTFQLVGYLVTDKTDAPVV